MPKIVIVGGRGVIGARLAQRLAAQGHQVLPASRASGVDAVTGTGLKEALAGAHTVVDVTNAPSFEPAALLQFFGTATKNLLSAEAAAGVQHHIVLSIVGVDRMPDVPYMRAKVAQEALIREGRVPYTIVRATQFFEFIGTIADVGTVGETAHLPAALFQPIAADDVVAALSDLAAAPALNDTIDLAGPEQFRLADAAQRFRRATADPRPVTADPQARYFGGLLNDQSLVPQGRYRAGGTRFEEWLASRS